MIYRVLTVAQGAEGAGAYRHVLEVLVESSALYAVPLIFYVAFFARRSTVFYYLDPIAGIMRVCFLQARLKASLTDCDCRVLLRRCLWGAWQRAMLERKCDDFATALRAG